MIDAETRNVRNLLLLGGEGVLLLPPGAETKAESPPPCRGGGCCRTWSAPPARHLLVRDWDHDHNCSDHEIDHSRTRIAHQDFLGVQMLTTSEDRRGPPRPVLPTRRPRRMLERRSAPGVPPKNAPVLPTVVLPTSRRKTHQPPSPQDRWQQLPTVLRSRGLVLQWREPTLIGGP